MNGGFSAIPDHIARRISGAAQEGFHKTCSFRVVSYGQGRARVELDVTAAVENLNGMLHGGAIATLIDQAGTIAVLTADREGRPGVSTDLNITFLRSAAKGTTVVAEAVVLKVGRTLAFVTVDVRRATDGVLLAQGRMTKYQAGPPEEFQTT